MATSCKDLECRDASVALGCMDWNGRDQAQHGVGGVGEERRQRGEQAGGRRSPSTLVPTRSQVEQKAGRAAGVPAGAGGLVQLASEPWFPPDVTPT